jgi:ATP-binding cassette subfamily F protein 3
MISVNKVQLMRGSQILLRESTLVIKKNQKLGLIGRNGSGKTSFFNMLAGSLPLEVGEVSVPAGLRVSIMAQEISDINRTALDFVVDAHKNFRKIESALKIAEKKVDSSDLISLMADFEQIGGYDVIKNAKQLLSGLGFKSQDFSIPINEFSGGWRVRLNLAATLMMPADLLMLDEPTNHLDLKTTLWLEQWLKRYQGMLLIISHDRTFLDKVIMGIISIENFDLVQYKGSFSDFERQKSNKMSLEKKLLEKQNQRRSEIENFVRRFSAKASKARQARSRIKELERMQIITTAYIDSPFYFRFFNDDLSSGYLMQADSLQVGYESVVVDKITINISVGSRVGFLGLNGSGKSTLLKVLAGKMQKLDGSLSLSKRAKIGYFGQHQIDELDCNSSPLDIIQNVSMTESSQVIQNFLGGFGFTGQRVNDQISKFSGGEKARLALARLVSMKPNLLLLDEPTNHLDLEMIEAVTTALQTFNGAIIVVSHNRHLLSATVDEFFLINEGTFAPFDGDLKDYETWLKKSLESKNQDSRMNAKNNFKRIDRKNSAILRVQTTSERRAIKLIEADLDQILMEIATLDNKMTDASLYSERNKKDLEQAILKRNGLKAKVSELEELWFGLNEALDKKLE